MNLEIPGYRVQRELGLGGMARVYLAIQESLDREVAIKVLSTELVSDPDFCQRFLKEGRTLAKLTHPHVLTIYDSGEHEGVYYMCMELIRGGTLEDRIADDKLHLSHSVDVLKQVASALEWSHGKGLVHRDIKPANVLFRDDRTAVLSDFGIAKTLSKDATRMTAAGIAIGTPTYMSPEQASAQELTASSDQYSLGVMFYEMLTGKVPFDGETSISVALQHLQAPVPQLPEKYANLQPIIDKMMAKDPADRFATLEEMLVAAGRAVEDGAKPAGTEVIDTPTQGTRSDALPRRTRPMILAAIGGLAALALVGGVYYMVVEQGASPTEQTEATEPPTPDRVLDPATRQEVDKWLEIAKTHYDIGRLTDPPGNNALDAYRKVLELDPGNPRAREGLNNIAATYEQVARESLEQDRVGDAREVVEEGLRLFPDNKGLAALQDSLPGG